MQSYVCPILRTQLINRLKLHRQKRSTCDCTSCPGYLSRSALGRIDASDFVQLSIVYDEAFTPVALVEHGSTRSPGGLRLHIPS